MGEEAAALQRGGLFLLRSARAVSQSCPNNPRGKEEGGLLKDPLLGVGLKELKSLQAFERAAVILIALPPNA